MSSYRKAREASLQILFQKEFHESNGSQDLFFSFVDHFDFAADTKDYCLYLVDSILQNEKKVIEKIEQHSENWRFDRMARIDQILLQIAVFELCFSEKTETPPKLVVSDIIDLSKKYSSHDAKNFINGILDQILNEA